MTLEVDLNRPVESKAKSGYLELLNHRTKELALFDLGLDSKLRACALMKLRVKDFCHEERVATRAITLQ